MLIWASRKQLVQQLFILFPWITTLYYVRSTNSNMGICSFKQYNEDYCCLILPLYKILHGMDFTIIRLDSITFLLMQKYIRTSVNSIIVKSEK